MAEQLQSFSVETPSATSSRQFSRRQSSFAEEYQHTERKLSSFDNGSGDSSGVSQGIFNLANTIMGASLSGLPFVMKASGIVPFVLFMSFSAFVGSKTLQMLVDCCDYLAPGRKKDYQAVGEVALGKLGLLVVASATVLSCFGALTSYIVLVGTTAPVLCKMLGFDNSVQWHLQLGAAVFLIWPLCVLKDIGGLAPASFFALTVFVLMAFTALGAFLTGDNFYFDHSDATRYNITDAGSAQWFPDNFGLKEISQFPTLIMAFNCQYALLPIIENLKGGKENAVKVIRGGMVIPYMVNLVLASSAYLAYQGHTQDMILLNFRHCYGKRCTTESVPLERCPKSDVEMLCADDSNFIKLLNLLFLVAVLLGYPCVHFGCRKAQVALCFGVDSAFSWKIHTVLATFNVLLSLAVALLVGDKISTVFRWTGAVASPLISFVLPSLFYFLLLGQQGEALTSSSRMKGLAGIMYGGLVMLLGVICNVMVP